MKLVIVVLSALISVGEGALNCTWANQLDCTNYGTKKECGTDAVTYLNRCYFAKAYCKDNSLHIYSDSDCVSAGLTTPKPSAAVTTPGPTGPTTTRAPIFLGHNAVMDFFCRELSKQSCPNDTQQVCGSDNQTYPNVCEFEKQRCTHRNLTVTKNTAC